MTRVPEILVLLLGLLVFPWAGFTQAFDPVQWSFEMEPAQAPPGGRVLGKLKAVIESPWHFYSPTNPRGPLGGGIPAEITLEDNAAVKSWKLFQPLPLVEYDPNFQVDAETYGDEAVFLLDIELSPQASGRPELTAKVRYQACTKKQCLPPARKTATAGVDVSESASAQPPEIPEDYEEVQPGEPREKIKTTAKPETESEEAAAAAGATGGASGGAGGEGLLGFAVVAFGFGLLAIFTPCVFPMIPITMSYFVSTQADQPDASPKASLPQALTFSLGVIVMFTGLGTLVSVILGPFGITQLGANVWVNLFIALVFTLFAASLLGAFEITAPSGALNRLNQYSNRGGVAGTLAMGLVFALASFACTGPFVGTLLAGSITGGLTWPILGMLFFSTGLALPFFFLALFPSYLSRLPKSGGWLARTKVTMGFIILAVALKYFSNVDQVFGWELLSRERFLAAWVVLASLAGLYLLGFLRLSEDDGGPIGLGRLGLGAVFLVTALSLVPGMFGGHLGELEAYVPAADRQQFLAAGGGGGSASQVQWLKDDYEGALQKARESGQNVLISFTGYTCTNCKWMKTNMFTKPEIAGVLDDLVLVELYTDGMDETSEQNQQLQLSRFETVAIPYYAIVGPDESVVAEFPGRTRDTEEFREFLEAGLTPPASAPAEAVSKARVAPPETGAPAGKG